jgi:hypothetical protein
MKRVCKTCKEEKDFTEYYHQKGCRDGIRPVCKKCVLINNKKFAKANPERHRKNRRNAGLRYLYGIGNKEYEEMKEKQGHRCGICMDHEDDLNKRLVVDHCHKSGKVRALLCDSCNVGLGKFKDESSRLFDAHQYLLEHKE